MVAILFRPYGLSARYVICDEFELLVFIHVDCVNL